MKRLKRYTKILKNVYTLKKIKSCFWGNNFFSNFRGSKVQNFHFSYIFWILTYFKFQNSHIFMAIFALNVIQKLTGTNCFILSRILFYLDENTWYCNRKRASTKKIIGRILQNHFFWISLEYGHVIPLWTRIDETISVIPNFFLWDNLFSRNLPLKGMIFLNI